MGRSISREIRCKKKIAKKLKLGQFDKQYQSLITDGRNSKEISSESEIDLGSPENEIRKRSLMSEIRFGFENDKYHNRVAQY